jgi:pyruvate dehydrogenase E2 component (dihydrolipoamide acetyltransferase)
MVRDSAASKDFDGAQEERQMQWTTPVRGMRRSIAERMRTSLQTMAQLTLHVIIDASALVRLRRDLDAVDGEPGPGRPKISYEAILGHCVSQLLSDSPQLNAVLENGVITRFEAVNLGFAVALPDGLIVPVIHDSQRLSITEIAAQVEAMATRARQRTLELSDVVGGTFTMSNLGMFSVDSFTPIINPPQVAILGIGRIHSGSQLTLSLTIDHQAVDGAPAAKFLSDLEDFVVHPERFRL